MELNLDVALAAVDSGRDPDTKRIIVAKIILWTGIMQLPHFAANQNYTFYLTAVNYIYTHTEICGVQDKFVEHKEHKQRETKTHVLRDTVPSSTHGN